MSKILAVGIATLDIINYVNHYPDENEEIRVQFQQRKRGGNATNTLTVLSQLGHQCHWSGVLVNEVDTSLITRDLDYYGINYQHAKKLSQGKMPTSYITLNQANGSRSIVHYRDCPELDFAHFQQLPLNDYDWVHFEGRHIDELDKMLDWLKLHHPGIPCSIEVEKPRQYIETLFTKVDALFFSQAYVESLGFDCAEDFLQQLDTPAITTCTWGSDGAWLKKYQQLLHSPAFPPEKLIDTLGAGDTFNAGMISALLQQQPLQLALEFSCRLAGKKCGQHGFDKLHNL